MDTAAGYFFQRTPDQRIIASQEIVDAITNYVLFSIFEERRLRGRGYYILCQYTNDHELCTDTCNGSINIDAVTPTPEPSLAELKKQGEDMLVHLQEFTASPTNKRTHEIKRDKNDTYIRIKTDKGYLCGIYRDTNSSHAITGTIMLMIAVYVASRHYLNLDDTLIASAAKMLSNEKLPDINPCRVDELVEEYVNKN